MVSCKLKLKKKKNFEGRVAATVRCITTVTTKASKTDTLMLTNKYDAIWD